jgi:PhoH-like ATPase
MEPKSMDKTVLIDTNLFLDDPNIIFKLSTEYENILIPITVLKELDKHKFNKDLSYSARNAINSILKFTKEHKESILFDTTKYEEEGNDDKILASAKKYGATVATKDVSMSIIADSLGLKTVLSDVVMNNIFNPYVEVHANDLATDADTFFYENLYEDEEIYDHLITVFSKAAGRELDEDSWFFVIIDVDKHSEIIYANNPLKHVLERIDNQAKYIYINVDDTTIKARDCYQRCAIYALEEAPHVLITGRWGSGKTLLGTAHTLAKSDKKKTFITRAPLGINSKYDLGFMPGDKIEKMMDWLQGFMSAAYFIYGSTRGDKDKEGNDYDYVKEEIFHEKFEVLPMQSIQGMSLLDEDTLIVDEVQLITVDYMSMILSRPSETGRLVLLGDIKQTYDVVKPSESGLLKLLRVLPSKHIAYVQLQNSYRSPLLEVADKLQDVSIK